jgi:orotidine-5'-phosphate decarboxylase
MEMIYQNQTDRLAAAVKETRSPTVLGLDTRFDYLPSGLARRYPDDEAGRAEAVYEFNRSLLGALPGIVPCVKIQAAYYEMMGCEGMLCLRKTADEARRLGYVVIIDAKRGDIGATAEAYSAAYLAEGAPFRADFLTVNPYLGGDGVMPFVNDCEKTGNGIFALVKTSNPSSGEFQDVVTRDGRALYEHVADKVAEWGASLIGGSGYSSVGAVVGATYPEQGARLRARLPRTFFLLPGYGAQGASADALAGCFDKDGGGAVVNASRSILLAYVKNPKYGDDFAAAARDEAIRMRDELREALKIYR